jgi:N-acylneuraminate cytidylyltransferase/CMP-N,N'-diacetyllegionaminic acid synthase
MSKFDRLSLAILVARKGSKGLPGKNTKVMNGKPLIQWTIEQALRSRGIGRVVVSSDDEQVLSIARSLSCETVNRPSELANDETPVSEAISHALDELDIKDSDFNSIVLLEPTSPLRPAGFIDSCLTKFLSNPSFKSAVSVAKVEGQHPDFSMSLEVDGTVNSLVGESLLHKRRQDLEPIYFLEGSLYATTAANFREHNAMYGVDTLGIIVEKWQSFEVDDMDDFTVVEALMREHINEL